MWCNVGNALPKCEGDDYTQWTNCEGTYTDTSGGKYVGEWKNGKANGQGTYTDKNGDKHIGEYKDSKFHGQGTLIYTNGAKYVGEFKDDKPNGQGTHTYYNGDIYVGEVKDGEPNGQGTLTWANGDIYVGEVEDSKPNGQGTITWANGVKYVGEVKDGKPNGQGTITMVDGAKYVGEWKDFKFHGQGTRTDPSGEEHIGEWKDGEPHGQGTHTFANGDIYVGEFKEGLKHGQGTYTKVNGDKSTGEWKDDELVKTNVDDIRNLKIEGISIGDSLLDHLSKEEIIAEIERTRPTFKNLTEEFGEVFLFGKFEIYEDLSFFVKPDDENYTIYSITGAIKYDGKIDQCYAKQKEIGEEFSVLYKNTKKTDGGSLTPDDRYISFVFYSDKSSYGLGTPRDIIMISCFERYKDFLLLDIFTKEVNAWRSGKKLGKTNKKKLDVKSINKLMKDLKKGNNTPVLPPGVKKIGSN